MGNKRVAREMVAPLSIRIRDRTMNIDEMAEEVQRLRGEQASRPGVKTRKKWIDWEPYVELFGLIPDAEIAEVAGVTRKAVAYQRNKRGIPTYRELMETDWSKIPELGQMPDTAVAKKYHSHPSTVQEARVKLGIPAFILHTIDWDTVPLGEEHDRELAAELGVLPQTVRERRRRKGLDLREPRPSTVRGIPWENVTALGKVPDALIGIRFDVSSVSVRQARVKLGIPPFYEHYGKKDIPWDEIPELGQMPDAELAVIVGVSPSKVYKARQKRGIPVYSEQKVDWDSVTELGILPDGVIAERYGVSRKTVMRARRRKGIGPYEKELIG